MSGAPQTLEGWWSQHLIWHIDWCRWKQVPAGDRAGIIKEAQEFLQRVQAVDDAPEGASACYRILGQKGDIMLINLRPDVEYLHALELELAQLRWADYLLPAYSYLSVVELSMHNPESHGQPAAEMSDYVKRRLYPELPDLRTVCFYPMSKKRDGEDNWYTLPLARRGELMRDHGLIGRKYAGQVVQMICGSTGLDDWEWGVTLFADDPVQFKKIVYEMRFDEASARYGLFGPFYVGIRLEPDQLPGLMQGRLPVKASVPNP